MVCCTIPQPGGPGDFWSRFSFCSPWYASIKLQGSSVSFGLPPGTLFPRYPPYLESIPLSANRGGARWKNSNSSRVHTFFAWILVRFKSTYWIETVILPRQINPLNYELNPICYLLALLAHHFLHVSRIRVKLLTLRPLMSYIYIYTYGAPILDVSRSHTTMHHSR